MFLTFFQDVSVSDGSSRLKNVEEPFQLQQNIPEEPPASPPERTHDLDHAATQRLDLFLRNAKNASLLYDIDHPSDYDISISSNGLLPSHDETKGVRCDPDVQRSVRKELGDPDAVTWANRVFLDDRRNPSHRPLFILLIQGPDTCIPITPYWSRCNAGPATRTAGRKHPASLGWG